MTPPRSTIVETVTGRTMADLRAARDRATTRLVELRLDHVRDLDVAGALEGRRVPVIATIRSAAEGGAFRGSEEERLRLIGDLIGHGAEYVDVEWSADRRNLPANARTQLVLSHHDFAGVPADLPSRVAAMRREGAAVVKLAVTATRLEDCLVLRDAMRGGSRQVAIAMGAAGQVTRVCPWLFGSEWTYGGSLESGQVSVDDLQRLYRVESRSAATAIYAVAGRPLAHSASPAMHNAALAALGRDAVYVRLESDDAAEFLAVAEALGVEGASVTAPLKRGVFQRVLAADDVSRLTGSANTVKRAGGSWQGRNYDVAGFLAPLDRRATPLPGARAVVLGAGGAARTAIWALRGRGSDVAISTRREDAAAALAREFGVRTAPWPPRGQWDLMVNTTPVGTWPHTEEAPVPRDGVEARCVYDLIYNPTETRLLAWAREAGAETIGGLEMLVAQAACQLEWWTGEPAPVDIMAEGARAFIARTHGDR